MGQLGTEGSGIATLMPPLIRVLEPFTNAAANAMPFSAQILK